MSYFFQNALHARGSSLAFDWVVVVCPLGQHASPHQQAPTANVTIEKIEAHVLKLLVFRSLFSVALL